MIKVNESEFEYRFGNSGPKYLLRGPRVDMGLVVLQPGEDFQRHYHNIVEENFFVLEGEVDIDVAGTKIHAVPGDLIHAEPPEPHYLINNGSVACKMVFVKAPYEPKDKVDVTE
ncbi:hypothetical protein U27_06989 [Candidatus Vecturithrix granuli]|uniref:Cupin type-2 domain-containing protein n=1 Tax=Vecturithrix granuli TaxID=1499967 RepID=A0A081C5Z7_VECG1|nr:hypothetical protein U27_06989 [Candidatus Vecturithrix granuli]